MTVLVWIAWGLIVAAIVETGVVDFRQAVKKFKALAREQ